MTKLVFRAYFDSTDNHEIEISVYSTCKGFAVECLDNTVCEIVANNVFADFDEAIACVNSAIKANGWKRYDERIFVALDFSFDGGVSSVIAAFGGADCGSKLRASIAWGRDENTFSVCYDVESWGYASCLICDEYDEFSEAIWKHEELAQALPFFVAE